MHRIHDYRHLVARWREVARAAGVPLRPLGKSDGLATWWLRSPALARAGGLYLSAGIHGDEAAAPAALLAWAERDPARLARLPVMIFPCLNPWGLTQNQRANAAGVDLNRAFSREDVPHLAALKRAIAGHRFARGVMLHEDYDGQGFYLYELARNCPEIGRELVALVRPILPHDPRTKIDISRGRDGVIRRRKLPRRLFEKLGYPEAIWLQLHHTDHTLTLETPSEAALEKRIAAHVAVLDELERRGGF